MKGEFNMFVASPITNKKGMFLFDQIAFEYDALKWTDDIRAARQHNPSLSGREAVKLVTKDTRWHWAVGNMPSPDIAETDYCAFAFNARAMECLFGILDRDDFLDIGNGYYFLIYDKNPQGRDDSHIFVNKNGETIVDQVFKDRYVECGLTGLKFSDPSVPFWKR